MRTSIVAWLVDAAFVAACASSSMPPTSAAPATDIDLTIFAAASLRDPLAKAAEAYGAANRGIRLTISTDASSALETQIEQGAPADVFLSADTTNPEKLVHGGFAAGDPIVFAGNTLTIIVPKDNPARIATPTDLARPGVKIVAAGDAVPVTKYAKELVANLATKPGYPPRFEESYTANVVSREDNVKAVVAKIELGQGDAGIVYATDARASTRVAEIGVPPAANVVTSYAGVVVKASKQPDAAQTFLDWLAGKDGQAILSTFGFLPPPE